MDQLNLFLIKNNIIEVKGIDKKNYSFLIHDINNNTITIKWHVINSKNEHYTNIFHVDIDEIEELLDRDWTIISHTSFSLDDDLFTL